MVFKEKVVSVVLRTGFTVDSDLITIVMCRLRKGKVKDSHVAGLLLKFSQQVGLGMQYLSAKGFVHRDLASRNILVKKDKICKVILKLALISKMFDKINVLA